MVLALASACSADVMVADTVPGTGGETGDVEDANSPLCAPFEAAEADGGEFPPEGKSAVLYGCEGTVEVEISGSVCLTDQWDGYGCPYEIEMLPQGTPPQGEFAIGVPVSEVMSSTDTYPQIEIGACCIESASDDEVLNDALATVCAADCGARACIAAAAELAAILADEACLHSSGDGFNAESCRLDLPKVCEQDLCQAKVFGRTESDLQDILDQLATPEIFEQCQNSIRSEPGWKPCVQADCKGSALGQGRITELRFKAVGCNDILPVHFDSPDAPAQPDSCELNVNANPGAALPGQDFGGPLIGGAIRIDSPFGAMTIDAVGSRVGFRRISCNATVCPFALTELTIDVPAIHLGSVSFKDVHAELVNPGVGILRRDLTVTIEDGALLMLITLNLDGFQIPAWATNEGPMILLVTPDNTISILAASFRFPLDITTHLTTTPTQCVSE
ncbi:MAG: hypothetical protein HC927_11145 [Deltaproteobacteria bacterium]|nr:hypothetical protein [Deltaproteobacteria bacterium]